MISFSQAIKNEILLQTLSLEALESQLAALILANGKRVGDMCQCDFMNIRIAKQVVYGIKKIFNGQVEVIRFNRKNLGKEKMTRIVFDMQQYSIIDSLFFYNELEKLYMVKPEIIHNDELKRYFISGWFLAKGSINNLNNRSAHLEIRFKETYYAQFIQQLVALFQIEMKQTVRRNEDILYLKQADQISDLLGLMYSTRALLEFENARIHRDFHNSLRRLDNCEVANEMKTIKAGQKQLEAIYRLQETNQLAYLDTKLVEVAHLRLANPEASLNELSQLMQQQGLKAMSKSGIKHRLDKLIELAAKVS